MSDALITAAVRPPIGRAGGALADLRPDEGLATMCIGLGQGIALVVEAG